MLKAFCLVAALAFATLLVRSARVGIGGDWVDPVAKVSPQHEAVYASSAIRMAQRGGWLTPRFMGRLALYRPPLLDWLSGFSAWALGVSRLALRLPVALLCGLAVGLVFLWAAKLRGWLAGAAAAVILAGNHLWHVLASACLNDGLFTAFLTASLYALFADPALESPIALAGFSIATAAAILTKGLAGGLPLAVLAICAAAAPPGHRPKWTRLLAAAGLAAALAAPWFLYQVTAHGRWFWADHANVELLGFGSGAPPPATQENRVAFYLTRAVFFDPFLFALALIAAPKLFQALRRRAPEALLLGGWLAVPVLILLFAPYHSAAYLLPLTPALAIVAVAYSPFISKEPMRVLAALVAFSLFAKAVVPSAPWGISFGDGAAATATAAPVVSNYCQRNRSSELILVGMDDDLYATVLPLAGLRYAVVAPSVAAGASGMDFALMGIVVTADKFAALGEWAPSFRHTLAVWGLDSSEPIATLVLAGAPEELAGVVRSRPGSDFLARDEYRAIMQAAAAGTHDLVEAGPGHFLLLSRQGHARPTWAPWSCWM